MTCIWRHVERDDVGFASGSQIIEEGVPSAGGWGSVQVDPQREIRCYRCREFGHASGACKGVHRSKLCFNCGREGQLWTCGLLRSMWRGHKIIPNISTVSNKSWLTDSPPQLLPSPPRQYTLKNSWPSWELNPELWCGGQKHYQLPHCIILFLNIFMKNILQQNSLYLGDHPHNIIFYL